MNNDFDLKPFIAFADASFINGIKPFWNIPPTLPSVIENLIQTLGNDYTIRGNIAIHKTAVVEEGAILKGPLIISEHGFVGAHAYLRGGVFLDRKVSVGPGCEIKSSYLFPEVSIAHFNFVGDSVIGSNVNMEAGSIIANHYNEREQKEISFLIHGNVVATRQTKFGALVGDHCRIGANAVLSPGTILPPSTIIKRLELVEQVKY